MAEPRAVFVGVDWSNSVHQVCATDQDGNILCEAAVPHDPEQLASMCAQLLALAKGDARAVQVSIERPDGIVVDTLLHREFRVFTLNPKQLDRFRDRLGASGAKDDRRDARVLALSLRTDPHSYRRVEADSPWTIMIRDLSRERGDLTQERVRLENKARDHLLRYYPQLLGFGDLNEWMAKVWSIAPSPEAAARDNRLTGKVSRVLQKYRIRRVTAADVVRVLRGPRFEFSAGVAEAAQIRLRNLFARLSLVRQQLRECERAIEAHFAEATSHTSDGPSDVEIALSIPGVGPTVLAGLLAEGGRSLRQLDHGGLRVLSGVAPVTRRSGKWVGVVQRQACNRRLRESVYNWARVAAQCDEHTRRRYTQLRGRGKSHGRTLRSIGDKLLRVLCAMLRDRTLYVCPS